MFTGSEQLSKQENIKYTYVALDVGVAIKEFHVQWNQPESWSKVIINLGNIYAVMDFLVQLDHKYLVVRWRKLYTVKPVYSGHLRFLKNVSAITRCLLYRVLDFLGKKDNRN